MRFQHLVLVVLLSVGSVNAQSGSLSSAIGISYSGINHNLRLHNTFGRFDLGVGPSVNYSKQKLPWSASPGVNTNFGYQLIDSGSIQTQVFVNYLLLPFREASIQEVNVGYTMFFRLSKKLNATNSLGFGGYSEKGEHYSINGLSYCVNFGLSYRL
ncbi:MAG: hypothetical protein ACI9UJ_001879 [bacterium]|jgi:hypothetical protein